MRTVRHLPLAGSPGSRPGESRESTGVRERLASPPDQLWEEAGGARFEGEGEGEERFFQVGDLAKATGKTVRAIHHYEEVGLLQPHARSKGRYRLYDNAALTRIRWISKLHDLGMSLAQIQQLLKAWEAAPSAPGAMAKIRGIYLQKLEETRAQIERLGALERELRASIDYLDTCDTCDPAELVRACTKCNVHTSSQLEPELVAGIHGGNGNGRHGDSP
ncbi:MAG TPA: MerR family transcriptional regulator [Polyangiaceae bacterium]|jgi:DNA-binding transcriptional MerR regulator|nr:MerR family transcriptional regulator [Polyangiaceae bacterium]